MGAIIISDVPYYNNVGSNFVKMCSYSKMIT